MTVTASETLSNSKAYQTPSDLLSRFIAQQQELQNYKYVLCHVWHVAANTTARKTVVS